jgi:MFS family permease
MHRSLERNVVLYKWFQFAAGFYAWLPVFFLYLNQFVTLAEVIQLGSIYYLSVCFWEIPSGYFSDRFGRKATLLIAGFSLIIAYTIYLAATGFAGLALAQFFLAMGIAMMSGTDTAFLYDSLRSLERQDEYVKWDARAHQYSFAASAIAALAGGAMGIIDLRWAYWLSMAGAVCMVVLAFQFVEPAEERKQEVQSMVSTIMQCFGHLSNRVLAWLFAIEIIMYYLTHIMFEFYQPYIRVLDISLFSGDNAALVSALVMAVSMFGGSLGAALSVRLDSRLGLVRLLLIALAIQLLILVGLSSVLSVFVLMLVMARNVSMAMVAAPVNAAIAPRIGSHLRATYLSVQSLVSRLFLAGLLFIFSRSIDSNAALDWTSLSLVLQEALVIGTALVLVVSVVAITVIRNISSGNSQ